MTIGTYYTISNVSYTSQFKYKWCFSNYACIQYHNEYDIYISMTMLNKKIHIDIVIRNSLLITIPHYYTMLLFV